MKKSGKKLKDSRQDHTKRIKEFKRTCAQVTGNLEKATKFLKEFEKALGKTSHSKLLELKQGQRVIDDYVGRLKQELGKDLEENQRQKLERELELWEKRWGMTRAFIFSIEKLHEDGRRMM